MGRGLSNGWEVVVRDIAPEGFLNELSDHEVRFYAAQFTDAVTVYLQVSYGDVKQVRAIAERRGAELKLCRSFGVCPKLVQLKKRYALLCTLVVCAAMLGLSNLFVWQIHVTGNETVPTGEIIRAVTRAGGGIGSFWPAFDGEQMRTEIMLQLKEIQWVGINYCTGVIEVVVRERTEIPKIVDNDEPMHVVAEKAGVITRIASKQGQTRAAAGDTVEKGQVLISGAAVSIVGTTRTVHALGDVEARTWYALSARQPASKSEKAYSGKKNTKISLIIGTNRLNFYSDSSIFGDTCDTIKMDYHLCMEDVFSFPVRIMVQQCVYWDARERELEAQEQEELARNALMEVLKEKIGEAGSVITADFAAVPRDGGMTVTLMAECLEEIGEEVPVSEEELRHIQSDNTLREEETAND